MPVLGRPLPPAAAEPLRQRTESRELAEPGLLAAELLEPLVRALPRHRPDRVERARLQREDLVAIDQAVAIEPVRLVREPSDCFDFAGPFDVLDPQVERAAETPAGWKVRTRLLRERR